MIHKVFNRFNGHKITILNEQMTCNIKTGFIFLLYSQLKHHCSKAWGLFFKEIHTFNQQGWIQLIKSDGKDI